MKLRHIILFIIACIVLSLSQIAGGPLIALFAWLQIYTLLTQPIFTKQAQLWAFKIFLISIPLMIFWGSIHSFMHIYLTENNWQFAIMTLLMSTFLCMFAAIYFVFTFNFAAQADYKAISSLDLSLKFARANRREFFKTAGLILIFSLVPLLGAEWKIIFAIMATHSYLRRAQLKQVFLAGF